MRTFSARETEWLQELDGIELAGFWRRAFAFVIDWIIVGVLFSIIASLIAAGVIRYMQKHGKPVPQFAISLGPSEAAPTARQFTYSTRNGHLIRAYKPDERSPAGEAFQLSIDVLASTLYFGFFLWRGNGRTPGKRITRIRVVSLVHRHMTFWHSVERALGYGAAALEAGFGFFQFFLHPYRRCAQDRLAETIVVTERGYQALQHKFTHALQPDLATTTPAADIPDSAQPETPLAES